MLRTLDSFEISEWDALEKIEPYGERAAYWRTGLFCSLFANAHRKVGAQPFKAEDFMPKFDEGDEDLEATGQQLVHSMEMTAEFFNQRPKSEWPG